MVADPYWCNSTTVQNIPVLDPPLNIAKHQVVKSPGLPPVSVVQEAPVHQHGQGQGGQVLGGAPDGLANV